MKIDIHNPLRRKAEAQAAAVASTPALVLTPDIHHTSRRSSGRKAGVGTGLVGGVLLTAALIGGTVYADRTILSSNNDRSTTVVVPGTPGTSSAAGTPGSGETAGVPEFPLAGRTFNSNRVDANGVDLYRVVVTADGRYWQDQLPDPEHRGSYAVALLLPRGHTYRFDGIVANAYLDLANNGLGSRDTRVAHDQNDVLFTVPASNGTEPNQQNAWFLVEGQGGVPGGFQLQADPPVTQQP